MKKTFLFISLFTISLAQAKNFRPQTATLTCSFDLKCAKEKKEKITWNIDLKKKIATEKKTVLNPRSWEIQSHSTIYQKKLSYMGEEIKASPNLSPDLNQMILRGDNWDDNVYLMVMVYEPGSQAADVTIITSGGGGACSDQSLSCVLKY